MSEAPKRRHVLAFLGSWPGQLTAVGALTASALLSPSTVNEGPVLCPVRRTTELECPGCGLTRAFVSLTHGDLDAALGFHPFSPLVYAVLIGVLLWALVPKRWRPLPIEGPWLRLWRIAAPTVVVIWLAWWLTTRLGPALL